MAKPAKVNVCIIGSGAGGSVVAKELGEQGISVVVLEAGRRFDPLRDFNVVTSNDWERMAREHTEKFKMPKMDRVTINNSNLGRPMEAFGVGGSTLRYLAEYVRFLPDDFRIRTADSVGVDWPLTYEDLSPYYRKVELELAVSGKGGDYWFPDIDQYGNPPFEFAFHSKIMEKSFNKLGMHLWPLPVARLSRPFEGRPACVNCGYCGYGCMIKAKSSADVTYIAKAESTGNVEIRPESVTTHIKINSQGKIKSVIYADKNGLEHEQEAEIVIVSAGSIQSPRILLNSKSSLFPDGLANSSGMVGKNYMIHTYISSSALLPDRVDSFRGHAGAISLDYARTNKNNPFARGFSMKPKSNLTGPAKTAINTAGWGLQHKDYMRKNFGHIVGMNAIGEQLPEERNCVELDPEAVDDYGMPVPRITFKLNENDKLIIAAMKKKMHEIYSAAGASDVEINERENFEPAHNMGTCRMGKDPRTSVLNSFCQSHDVKELFVIDASCFVSSSTSNPSLTIQAIAKRSAEYIIHEVKKGNL
ncbi:MAG: GMC family oxidoreductase [Nitrospiraceae bacterium]|nr:MAG: GMC family oxidoreductase [Nitrospiraceae bacterium]